MVLILQASLIGRLEYGMERWSGMKRWNGMERWNEIWSGMEQWNEIWSGMERSLYTEACTVTSCS